MSIMTIDEFNALLDEIVPQITFEQVQAADKLSNAYERLYLYAKKAIDEVIALQK